MERKPHSTGSIVGAVVLLVVVLLALYVGGYFLLGKYSTVGSPLDVVIRDYPYDWQATTYWPMLQLEGAKSRKEVWVRGPNTGYTSNGQVGQRVEGELWQWSSR